MLYWQSESVQQVLVVCHSSIHPSTVHTSIPPSNFCHCLLQLVMGVKVVLHPKQVEILFHGLIKTNNNLLAPTNATKKRQVLLDFQFATSIVHCRPRQWTSMLNVRSGQCCETLLSTSHSCSAPCSNKFHALTLSHTQTHILALEVDCIRNRSGQNCVQPVSWAEWICQKCKSYFISSPMFNWTPANWLMRKFSGVSISFFNNVLQLW